MEPAENNRRFTRIPIKAPTTIIGAAGKTITGTLQNLAMGGLLIHAAEQFPEGAACTITIRLGDAGDIDMRGCVVRAEPGAMGIECMGIAKDSVKKIADLLVANADNPDELLNELSNLSHMTPETY